LRQRLDREPVAVPPEAPFDIPPTHAPVAGNDVFDRAGEEMTIVWSSGGERRTVVKDERFALRGRTAPIRFLKRIQRLPEAKTLLLERGDICLRGNLLSEMKRPCQGS
jgi:hypothetical protein